MTAPTPTPTPTTTATGPASSVPWNKIEEYVVTYPANKRTPRINLVAGSGTFVGELIFVPNGETLPADTRDQAHYHLDDFANLLDLLRNERPIYYIHNGPGDDNANGFQTGGTVGTGTARQGEAIQRLEDEVRIGRSSRRPAPIDGARGVDRVVDEFVSRFVGLVRSLPIWLLAAGDAVSAVVVLVFLDWLSVTIGLSTFDVVWPVRMALGGLVFAGSVTARRWWHHQRAAGLDRALPDTRLR